MKDNCLKIDITRWQLRMILFDIVFLLLLTCIMGYQI